MKDLLKRILNLKPTKNAPKQDESHHADTIASTFSPYKLPTLIIVIGLVLSVGGFLLALNYEMDENSQNFNTFAEQAYRTVDSEIRRHNQQITAVGRFLGQIRDFSEEEFVDISNSFTINTYFETISILELKDGAGATDLFPNGAFTKKLKNLGVNQAVFEAMEKSQELGTTYFSETFEMTIDNQNKKLSAFVTPINSPYSKNPLFLVGVLDIARLLENSLQIDGVPVNTKITKITSNDERIIYEQFDKGNALFFNTIAKSNLKNRKFERARFFQDYAWQIMIFPSQGRAFSTPGLFPWVTLLTLLTLSTLIGYIAFRITIENVRIRHIVEEQTESLRNYTEDLEQRNRDLDDFAYIASHDLKEPLRGIYNYSEFLKDDYSELLPKEGQTMLDTLCNLSRRMETLIDNLLRYSKLSREKMLFTPISIKKVVNEALETFEIMIKEQNVHVHVENDLPLLKCDEAMATEIFRNLIANAIKYNDKDEKRIRIGAFEKGNEHVMFVKDNGIGIPKTHYKTIFKIFKRLHGREEFGGGTGSGLTIIHRLVDRHHGKIWLDSQVGKGTTFYFTLGR